MTGSFTRRGQPLLALVLLMGAWVSARAMMWEPRPAPHIRPFIVEFPGLKLPSLAGQGEERETDQPAESERLTARAPISIPQARGELQLGDYAEGRLDDSFDAQVESPVPVTVRPAAPPGGHDLLPPRTLPVISAPVALPSSREHAPVPVGVAIGHRLLWMAALARVPLPAAMTDPGVASREDRQLAAASPVPGGTRRWSADGWILWRRGSIGATSGALLTPSYGASQAGAVIRYRLAPSSGMRPAAYLRTTAALNGTSEREAALGLQLRPLRGVPVLLAAEARMTAVPGRTYVRPTVLAVTELPPFKLPLGMRGEAYGQAGYVGGSYAMAFADGQLRVDRRLAGIGRADLRLGGGVWGGVQKGASRIDAGPAVTIGRPLGGSGSMRLAADWRFRVAGKASPGSGPAITLSAGF